MKFEMKIQIWLMIFENFQKCNREIYPKQVSTSTNY